MNELCIVINGNRDRLISELMNVSGFDVRRICWWQIWEDGRKEKGNRKTRK